jgi:hypothetical protein
MESREAIKTAKKCPVCVNFLLLNPFNKIDLFCVSCDYRSENKTFTETIDILDDLKTEFAYLESVKQCAKELLNIPQKEYEKFSAKIDELKHLVMTD